MPDAGTSIGAFDYDLPEAAIAQHPVEPRDAARLLENLQPLPAEPMRPAAEFLRLLERPRTARPKPAASAVLVFELNQRKFRKAKSDFDKLIARHDLTCNVRIE